MSPIQERPEVVEGLTIKVKTGCGNMYIVVNRHDKRMHEVFSVLGKSGSCAYCQNNANATLISHALRGGVEPERLIKDLIDVRCAEWNGSPIHPKSCLDAIAKAMRQALDIWAEMDKKETNGDICSSNTGNINSISDRIRDTKTLETAVR